MPPRLMGPQSIAASISHKLKSELYLARKYKSKYPEGLNLTPGSKLHTFLVSEILSRARESERAVLSRMPHWDSVDKTLTAYINLDEAERLLKEKDERKPVSIVVPESFASLETFLSYMMSTFGDYPTARIEGTGPEDIIGGILTEGVLDGMAQQTAMLLDMQTHWRDGFSLGYGILTPGWDVVPGMRSVVEPIYETNPYTGLPTIIGYNRHRESTINYEGITTTAIDPRKYLPDTTVPIHKPQSGEYVGWVSQTSYNSLLREEAAEGSTLFNVEYLSEMRGIRTAILNIAADAREALGSFLTSSDESSSVSFPIDVIWMFIDLVPNDWELGTSTLPEKWLFALASDQIIISAHAMNLDHGMFPVTVCAPDSGGHEVSPVSRMEILSGYQTIANYLVNTHITETDKFLKNRFVADPKLVYITDILKGRPIIRTRQKVWGQGVENTFKQVEQTDVTRAHMSDLMQIIQLSRQHGGNVDAMLGVQRQRGERVTAEEFSSTLNNAVNRLQRIARTVSMQSHIPLFKMHVSHIQQFMSQNTYIKTIGRWEEVLRQEYGAQADYIEVTPFDLNISHDLRIQDSALVGGESASSWIQWLQIIMQVPQLATQIFDIARINLHIARLMGNRAPEQFMLNRAPVNVQVQGDEKVMESYQRGRLVRLGEI